MTALPDMAVVAADLKRMDEADGLIPVGLDAYSAFCVIGQIQLAVRHPENFGNSAEIAVRFARALAEKLPASAQAVVRAGWCPGYDE